VASGAPNNVHSAHKVSSRRQSGAFQSSTRWEDKRKWAQVETREVQTGYKEKDFPNENSQEVELIVLRGYAVSCSSEVFNS